MAPGHQNRFDALADPLAAQVDKISLGKRKQDDDEVVEHVEVDTLPSSLKGKEEDMAYAEYLELDEHKQFALNDVHLRYTGADKPGFKVGSKPVETEKKCLVQIHDPVPSHPGGENFGWPTAKYDAKTEFDPAVSDRRICEIAFGSESQTPSIKLRIQPPPVGNVKRERVVVHFFANSLTRSKDAPGIAFTTGAAVNAATDLPNVPRLTTMAGEENLWRTDLTLLGRGEVPAIKGAPVGRPIVTGMPSIDVERLSQRFTIGDQTLDDWERLIGRLYTATKLSFYCEWDCKKNAGPLESFIKYFRTAMYVTTLVGNFWFYQMGVTVPLSNKDYPFLAKDAPRWLVEKWNVGQTSDKKPVEAKAIRWQAFQSLEYGIFPDADSMAFAMRLGLTREQEKAESELERIVDSDKTGLRASFIETGENLFVANIFIMSDAKNSTFSGELPDIRKRIELSVTVDHKPYKLAGSVMEDIFESGADIVAAMASPKLDQVPAFKHANGRFEVNIKFVHDPKSVNRALSAVEAIQVGHQRKEGVDLSELCLRIPRRTGQVTDFIAKELRGNSQKKAAFDAEICRHGLNPEQTRAATLSCTSQDGYVLIHGPPGTGKTKTCMAIVCAFVAAGYKVIVTDPSNDAVDADVTAFEKKLPLGMDKTAFCRFRDAFYRSKRSNAAEEAAKPAGDAMEIDSVPPAAESSASAAASEVGPTPAQVPKLTKKEQKKAQDSSQSWSAIADAEDEEHRQSLFQQVLLHVNQGLSAKEAVGFAAQKLAFVKDCSDGKHNADTSEMKDIDASDFLNKLQDSKAKKGKAQKAERKALL